MAVFEQRMEEAIFQDYCKQVSNKDSAADCVYEYLAW